LAPPFGVSVTDNPSRIEVAPALSNLLPTPFQPVQTLKINGLAANQQATSPHMSYWMHIQQMALGHGLSSGYF